MIGQYLVSQVQKIQIRLPFLNKHNWDIPKTEVWRSFFFSKSVENSSVISASKCRGHNSISRHSTRSRILLQLQWSLLNLKPRSYVVLIQAKPSKQHWIRKSCTAWHCYCCPVKTRLLREFISFCLFVCFLFFFLFLNNGTFQFYLEVTWVSIVSLNFHVNIFSHLVSFIWQKELVWQ